MQLPLLSSEHEEIIEKVMEGKPIGSEEATTLLIRCPTQSLLRIASILRDKARPKIITYSRKVFFNVVNLCRDTCLYCTYKKLPIDNLATMMGPDEILKLAEKGRIMKCTEALIVTGERPEQAYPEARNWLLGLGYSNLADYLADIGEMLLRKSGLFPHTNAGSLTKKEMNQLRSSNVSIGVMLETNSERLMGPGMPHENAPSKHPKARLKTLQGAGELRIPLTTGLLIGIGESPTELAESLVAIRQLNESYSHIQEVIMQNFMPKPETPMFNFAPPDPEYFIRAVALSRIVMPDMNIQVPPNLTPMTYGRYISAGINDWGGISPLTIDHVNPEMSWPLISELENVTQKAGRILRARLPVYPEYIQSGFISEHLRSYTDIVTDTDGLVREDYLNVN